MKCPICGCKMKDEFMCPYCKITGKQVRNASNKEAKERIKKGDTKEIYSSSYLPRDVNNTRLLVAVLLGGIFGVHQFYVGKKKTGFFYLFSFMLGFISYVLSDMVFKDVIFLKYVMNVGIMFSALIIFLWISDIFKVLFKSFSIPVVLADVDYIEKETSK